MKRKKSFAISASVLLVLSAFTACGGQGGQQQSAAQEPDSTAVIEIPRDHTIYGLCGNGTAMNTLQLLTDSGDTLTLSIGKAQEEGHVFGGLQAGDRIAVMPNKDETEAEIVINQNTLLGDWVMPNPIDGSSEVGIRIKEGGVAESIEQSSIIYKTWKIYNGHLQILSQRDGGGDMEELNLYEILKLGADSLVYRTLEVPKEDEETFEYSRYKEPEPMDLHGLELEDSSGEFRVDN